MSIAADTRDAVRRHPFLLTGLRAGVVNYRAAAEFLDLDGDPDAIATALRRFAEDLPEYDPTSRRARVTMQRGVGLTDEPGDGLLAVGETGVTSDGELTAILATGDVDGKALGTVLARLHAEETTVEAAGVAGERLIVIVSKRAGARALRTVEDALDAVV